MSYLIAIRRNASSGRICGMRRSSLNALTQNEICSHTECIAQKRLQSCAFVIERKPKAIPLDRCTMAANIVYVRREYEVHSWFSANKTSVSPDMSQLESVLWMHSKVIFTLSKMKLSARRLLLKLKIRCLKPDLFRYQLGICDSMHLESKTC